MLLERENEKNNRGKATKLLPDDICDKLKDLDLKGSEPSEGKLNISLKHNTFSKGRLRDNFSEMKDSKKNNFGDDINKIGDQLSNVRITEKEYNFPTKNAEIVLNILCDNNGQDNKNYNIDSNINVDEEQPPSNERKVPKTDELKDEKVYMKTKSHCSSLIHNEVEKVDENTEKRNHVSNDSKKTDKKVGVVSRGPDPKQKIFHPDSDPYNACSRGHHSGGRVRVREQPFQPTMNGYQPWHNNSQFNISSNEQAYYPPSMQNPYVGMSGAPTANINIPQHAEQGISLDDVDLTVEQILQEHPIIYDICEALSINGCNNMGTKVGDNNQNNIEECLPGSPTDSGTSSLGSPGSYQPLSVGHDSGLDSPSHGIEYPPELPYDIDVMKVSDSQKGQVTQEWLEMWPASNERPDPQGGQDMQKKSDMPSGQVMQQGPFPQGAQQRLLPSARNYLQENQNNQFLPGIRDTQGQPFIHNQNIQGNKIIQEQNIQGQPFIHKQNIQGNKVIQENNIQEQLKIQKQNNQEQQMIQKKNICPKTQVGQMIQEGNQSRQIEEKGSDMQGGQSVPVTSYARSRDSVPQMCGLGESPTKTKLRPILPKPDLSSAKARFQNILDRERRLLAWVKINEKVIADPKQLESQDAEGDTDLMIACCNKFESHLEWIYAMVEKLRQKPNSLAIRNKQGHSALYLACEVLYDVPEVAAYIAEALVEQKVDVANMTYDGGFTLIQILEKKGDTHKKVLEGLLALKDNTGKNVFHRGGDVNANNFKDFNESILLL